MCIYLLNEYIRYKQYMCIYDETIFKIQIFMQINGRIGIGVSGKLANVYKSICW